MKKVFFYSGLLFFSLFSYVGTYAGTAKMLSLLNVPNRALSISSFHGPIASIADECTLFDKIAKRYQDAQIAEKADVQGWRSGRCYFSGTRNQPDNNLLLGVERNNGSGGDNGPLFPPGGTEFKIMSIEKLIGGGPDYFDTIDPAKKVEVQAVVDAIYDSIGQAQIIDRSLTSRYDAGNLEFRVRKSNEYLFAKMVILRDETLKNTAFKSGDAYAYCYYFKKVN